jgi:trk system potassium uptake protein TrkH
MVIPLITALFYKEWNVLVDFLIALGLTWSVGGIFIYFGEKSKAISWSHGMVVVAFSWLIGMLLCAIPYYLSGHFLSYLDSCFDAMSGFTTTGLTIIQDMDHLSNGLNMWRHLLTYVGGQGMVVLILTFLVRGVAGAYMMYVGEGKDERLLPNVIQTSREIWKISVIYMIIGTLILTFLNYQEGIRALDKAFLHGLWIFMSSWSTGGFAPHSQNIMFYHSYMIEIVTMIFMLLGSFNFILHHAVWSGQRSELRKNIEVISFICTVTLTFSLLIFTLIKMNIYVDFMALFRRGFYILLSGHTGTGLANIYAVQLIKAWGPVAIMAVTIAMAIGGSACSTCGGFKGLRVGIFFKGVYQEIKKLMLSENAVFKTKYHHIKDITLTDSALKMTGMILLFFIMLYFMGGLLGEMCGYPFVNSLFESVSAGSTTGLSCGITSAFMPNIMKIYYIFAMFAGRLEFLAIFVLIAFIFSIIKGK